MESEVAAREAVWVVKAMMGVALREAVFQEEAGARAGATEAAVERAACAVAE